MTVARPLNSTLIEMKAEKLLLDYLVCIIVFPNVMSQTDCIKMWKKKKEL